MAIVQVKSTNPEFSFLIRKNPETGMLLRSVRKGMAYGWYADDSTFNVYFKDADNEISYKQYENENFEYLNVSRYNTPLFPLNAINEFFATPFKGLDNRDVEGYEHTFTINLIHIELMRYIDFFDKHLKDYSFTTKYQAHKSYTLTITTRKSLYHLLHVTSVLCLFLSMFGNEYIDISDSILDKYLQSLVVIDAPFYIRSLFVRNFLSSKDRFKKYKSEIEQTSRYAISFQYGGTAMQRRNFIAGILSFNKSILDLGCGEGFYALPFAKKIENTYYAVDIDEETLEVLKRKAEARQVDNIALSQSIDHFLESYNGEQVDVIVTEVIEHMSQDAAAALIHQIYQQVEFDRLIITTPNADFNSYYELDGYRHDDHKWEMGQEAFQLWFKKVSEETGVTYEFVKIGDAVNGVHTTQGVIVRKKED
ncbi:MAG: class I SAM-dependent methyltransferase [Candidatus Pristimantibacillus sp.]